MCCSLLEEIGTDDGGFDLGHQFHHTRSAKVEFMVAKRYGIVTHVAHNIYDVLPA